MSIVYQLKVKASSLSKYRFLHTPNCYARITINSDCIFTTETVTGASPEWSECFEISLGKSSTIKVELFHVQSSSREVLRGAVLFLIGDVISQDHGSIAYQRRIHQPGMRFRKLGFVVISLSRKPQEQPAAPFYMVAQPSDTREEDAVVANVGNTAADSPELFSSILAYVQKVVQYGDSLPLVHPYAQAAWHALKATDKALQGQRVHDKINTLLVAIRDMLDLPGQIDDHSKLINRQDTIVSMMMGAHECALFIHVYTKEGIAEGITRDNIETTDRFDQFTATCKRLKANFDQGRNIRIPTVIRQLIPPPEDAETQKLLESLPGWDLDGARFDESRACLEGTRKQLLDQIRTWIYSSDEKHILWVSGGAGTGKTSVSNSVAVFFDNLGRLGASFYFNRDTAGLNTTDYLFGNLAHQIAQFNENGQFKAKSVVLSAIRSMGSIAAFSLQTQARKLIVDVTNAAEWVQPVVVVIDALDESGTPETRRRLLTAIAAEFPKLPQSIKVIITSRDEPDIRARLRGCSKEVFIDDAESTPEDITLYIEHRFARIRNGLHLSEDWPGTKTLQELVRRAGRLFIWASVACNFVEEKHDPVLWLDRLLDATGGSEEMPKSPLEKLDVLYNSILSNVLPDEDEALADFRYVVGSIIALEAPLTRTALDSLLGLGGELDGHGSVLQNGLETNLPSSAVLISSLQSILREDSAEGSQKDGPLRLLHPSLYEFLTGRADERFRIDPLKQNRTLAIRCLTIMNSQLKFDICQIGDRSLLNKDIADLPARMDRYFSEGLRYSCRAIGFHVTQVLVPDPALTSAFAKFVFEHLLHWIEAASLMREVSRAERCLHDLLHWMKACVINDSKLHGIVEEAIPFLRNSGPVIRLSALHTYYSALPLTPRTADLFRCFIHKVPQVPNIISSHPTWPAASVRVMEGHTGWARHVAFSPDGTKLASASDDKTARLWDVESGQAIGDAFSGHIGSVSYVMFSPDGNKLATASYDSTVRLWDVESGQGIGKALVGHTGRINNVVFSPDGRKLASASYDGTVRIWDVLSGQPIGDALKEHTEEVSNVVFSPNGNQLASASYDGTVMIWDIQKSKSTGKVLKGHASLVHHVTISHDGTTLASASSDRTIRRWDVEHSKEIGEPLKGHSSQFSYYVTFSPDGKKLASASRDQVVRLWKIEGGRTVMALLEGHTREVTHVAFSPDSSKLVSASSDGTARLWDTERCQAIVTLRGHTDVVRHVMFTPDGTKLASASNDKTVRLWDVEGGQTIAEDPHGHTHKVSIVVLSQDGKKLATASDDLTVRLWDVESGKVIGEPLEGHSGTVRHVLFSQDGKKLVTASADKTVRLWKVDTGLCIGYAEALEHHTSNTHADGKTLQIQDITDDPWITEAFITPTDHSSGDGIPKLQVSDSDGEIMQMAMSFDELGFLRHGAIRLVWLPVMLRGCIAFQSSLVVVGGHSGAVTIIRFPTSLSAV